MTRRIYNKNEITKKLTSLTLMAIMVAGGMTFAVPGMVPEAYAANANLFVSAENSQFDNYMAGPQVIEVVVRDSSISDTDELKGEPDVTVNDKKLRMIQANDGNWYGYFADEDMVNAVDYVNSTDGTTNQGLNFGVLGGAGDVGLDKIEAESLYYSNGPTEPINVLRETKNLNKNLQIKDGQILDKGGKWPFIQLFELSQGGNVVIQYNKGGGAQSTTLTFDTVDDFAGIALDRTSYPQGAQVHATITDPWLNIDPTDEDSWTFATADGKESIFYQIFDESGVHTKSTAQLSDYEDLMCEDGCVLKLNTAVQGDSIITLQDNNDSVLSGESQKIETAFVPMTKDANASPIDDLEPGTQPITITEQGTNSGVFVTYDENDKSVILVTDKAARGTSATIDYNDTPQSVLVTHASADIDIQPVSDVWNSGEEIPVVLVDADANKNSRDDETLTLNDPTTNLIPSLSTGSPITLGSGGEGKDALKVYYGTNVNATETDVEKFSHRVILGGDNVNKVLIDLGITAEELQSSLLNTEEENVYGYNLFNYGIDALDEKATISLVYSNDTITGSNYGDDKITLVCNASGNDLTLLGNAIDCKNAPSIDAIAKNVTVGETLTFNVNAKDRTNNIVKYTVSNDKVTVANATITQKGQFSWTPAAGDIGEHTFTVTVTDSTDLFDTETVTVTVKEAPEPPKAPNAPTNLLAQGRNAEVALSWDAPTSGDPATGYTIQQSTDVGTTWTASTPSTSTGTTVTVTGLTNDQAYHFRVFATNDQGTGPASNVDTAIPSLTKTAPEQVTGLNATAGDTFVMLEWNEPHDGNSEIIRYNVQQSTDSNNFANATTAIIDKDVQTANVTGLDNSQLYFFKVSATNDQGTGPASNNAFATPTAGPTPADPNVPNVAPVITTITSKAVTVGQPLTFTVVATDANPADTTFTYTVNAPQGVTATNLIVPSTGVFTWTPVAADVGPKVFTFTAMDDERARSAPVQVTITVSAASNGGTSNTAPVVTPGQTPSGIAGTALSYQILATDDEGDSLTYGILSAGTATGLQISPSGLITWTTPIVGEHEVSFSIRDANAVTRATITITVPATSIVIPLLYNSGSDYEMQHFGTAFDKAVSDYDADSPKTFSAQKLNLGTTAIQSVLDTGAKGAVGTYTSEQLRILNDTGKVGTDVGDIVLLSYSSAATSFAEPGDGIFRLTTDTSRQVSSIVTQLIPVGTFDNVISIHLNDAWSKDYVAALEATYGASHRTIAYDTTAADITAEFRSVLTADSTGLSGLDAQSAIVILEYDHDRLDALVTELARTNAYVGISTTKFIIPDVPSGAFGSNLDANALDLLQDTDMKTIKFALSDNTDGQNDLKASLNLPASGEVNLDSFDDIFDRHAYSAYDAGQILTRAIDALGSGYTSAQLSAAIPTAATAYSSEALIYNTVLNTDGDLACMIYDVFEIDDNETAFALQTPRQATTDETNCAIASGTPVVYPPRVAFDANSEVRIPMILDNDAAYESQFFEAVGQAVLDHQAHNASQNNHDYIDWPYDITSNPTRDIENIVTNGSKAAIGTYTSEQLKNLNDTGKVGTDIVLLSYASTASTLTGTNEGIFRLTTDNQHQADKVLKPELAGFAKIISIHRGDEWSTDYVTILEDQYGANHDIIAYNSTLTNEALTGDIMKQLQDATVLDTAIAANTAIVILGFGEVEEVIMELSRNDGSAYEYTGIETTKIFIPDFAASIATNLNDDGLDLLKATDMKTIKFALKNDAKRSALNDVLSNGDTDERHVYAAYDAGKILARAIDELGKDGTVEQLKTKIPEVARAYNSEALIHSTVLGPNGDLECTTYDVLEINDTASSVGTIVFKADSDPTSTCDANDPDADGMSVPMLNNPQLVSCIDCAINSFGEIFGQTVQVHVTENNAGHPHDQIVKDIFDINAKNVGLLIEFDKPVDIDADPIVLDFFAFGFSNEGSSAADRTANQIVRLELEESDDNTSTFEGGLEYVMLNQLNILDNSTYTGLDTISDVPTFIVMEDLTDEDSPRVNYFDLGADGVSTQIADQQEAPSHSGVVALDSDNYKVADTVIITLTDADLNVDSELIDIFTVVEKDDLADTVGDDVEFNERSLDFSFGQLGRLVDVTFDDEIWTANNCGVNDALHSTGFTLIETETASGIFTGSFQIPEMYCPTEINDKPNTEGKRLSVTGTDIEVNYVDFRDASGEIIEVGDGAGVRANTGSISLDRTVYPVPFAGNAFPLHPSINEDGDVFKAAQAIDSNAKYLSEGKVTIHVRISDPDYDLSASGEDTIATGTTGPVKVTVSRGQASEEIATAGAATANATANEYGPITEIAPDAGIFEADIEISYKDGPTNGCPEYNPDNGPNIFDKGCVLQGDIVTVEYTDPTDASGEPNTVTDSATFDLRNAVLQSDKSVYIIGSDMILTLIEPDFDLDNDGAETYPLDLIEWDGDAGTTSMGKYGTSDGAFDPEPSDFRETGDSTGIFQIVIEIPEALGGDKLERGEEIELEYTDWGPSGSDHVGDEDEDINLTVFTSNFGSTVELDQKVYTWTDKVYITIVAPDHNFDSDLVDEIGNSEDDPIKIATRGDDLDQYKLVETGTDTGIFTGEVILTGFAHDANGDGETDDARAITGDGNGKTNGLGPTNGFLETEDDDGLSVSFEFSEDETVVGSALIRWNIGEVQWLEASYAASGTGVVRIIDPDMNLNPESVDNFEVNIWSDSDVGGIDLTVTETNQATGIFEGTTFFTVSDTSSGHRLRVSEGDTVTAEYNDRTLPDPHDTSDEIDITATTQIGSIIPPLERAPATNLRVVDAFSNTLDTITVDQQVQITADLANGQDKEQPFAYIVQIQNEGSVTVALAWVSGTLTPSQSFSPALSWTPSEAGTYTATAFVWESVDNPTALSPPNELTITVN